MPDSSQFDPMKFEVNRNALVVNGVEGPCRPGPALRGVFAEYGSGRHGKRPRSVRLGSILAP
jgi:hypothetical protein